MSNKSESPPFHLDCSYKWRASSDQKDGLQKTNWYHGKKKIVPECDRVCCAETSGICFKSDMPAWYSAGHVFPRDLSCPAPTRGLYQDMTTCDFYVFQGHGTCVSS